MLRKITRSLFLFAFVLVIAAPAVAQSGLTSPKAFFGFNLGDDYQLANYQQISAYWRKLAAESDRMVLETIGTTAEGRTQLMAIVSSPENIRNLDHYKEISRRLALAEGLTDDAGARARRGRARPWCGSTAGCTRPRCSAPSSSWRWSSRW